MRLNLLFLEQFSTISGGQIVLLQIIDSLDRSRYNPFVIIPSKGELSLELEKRQIRYFTLPMGRYFAGQKKLWDILKYIVFNFLLIPICFYLIKKNRINLVYANAPRAFFWGTIAANLSGCSTIWHMHSIISGAELKLCHFLLKYFKVNKIIAISKAVAAPFMPNKIEVVYNGVDIKRFTCVENDPQLLKQSFNIHGQNKVIGYIGQMAKWKGLDSFICAAEKVLKLEKGIRFLIIGDVLYGGKEGKRYKKDLFDLVSQLGIEDKVVFLGRRKDIPELLSCIDVLVVPSLDPEPLSLALMEGMASGKAVVAANHGGPAEIISDGVNGRLFPPGDSMVLSQILDQLIKDDSLRKKLGANARRKIEDELTLDIFAQKINRILNPGL